jgi:NADP-dependent 3-hydroxy acid dehydrogenase YdfG
MIKQYRIAVVTGASAGIGLAAARKLARESVKLVLVARREDKLRALAEELSGETECHPLPCDLRDSENLARLFKSLPDAFAAVDILVNNAGLALGLEPAHRASWEDWRVMMDVNCVALAQLTHLLLPGMVARNCGHIVNIGSIAGSYPYVGGNVYGATKAFVKQFSLNLKADLLGTSVRVTSIEPGMVGGTEFSLVRFKGDERKAVGVYEDAEPLDAEAVADAVVWAVSRPAGVNINRIELMPVCQAPGQTAVVRKSP